MEDLVFYPEILGTLAFALSGALLGIQKKMDIFGVAMLGIITAVGGGVIRDVMLGAVPPSAFRHPVYALTALGASVLIFLPPVRRKAREEEPVFEKVMLWADSIGLGVFTVQGVKTVVALGFGDNLLLLLFVSVITGVGGGVLRDMLAGERPYIFVKHIYACASIAGALCCALLRNVIGMEWSMAAGLLLILVIRLCSAKFHWSLPKAS